MRIAIAGLAALAAAGLGVPAPAQPETGPVTAIVHVDIGPPPLPPGASPEEFTKARAAAIDHARSLLQELAGGCTHEVRCRRIEVLQVIGGPNHFTLIETFDDRDALDAFEASDLSRRVRTGLQPLLGGPLDERLHVKLEMDETGG